MPFRLTLLGTPVTVHTNCRPLRWVKKLGLTLGSQIFLAPSAVDVWPALLAHEMGHVHQWREMGMWRFVGRYLLGLVTHGYRRHPMEREAMAYQRATDAQPDVLNAVRAMGGRV